MAEDEKWNTSGLDFRRFKPSNRDQALFLMDEINLEAQLLAIKGLLKRNREAEKQVSEAIEQLDKQARGYSGGDERYQMYMEDRWLDALHGTVFQDAAHSMSALGMLAPLLESVLVSIFTGLKKRDEIHSSASKIDERRSFSNSDYWNPHFEFQRNGRRRDLVKGTIQLSISTGLREFLPDDLEKVLSAIFSYRNKMFHFGFEWPKEERRKFAERIKNEKWPGDWFIKSTSDGDPWIFYMSSEFIELCLSTVDQILNGVGKYLATD